MGGRESRAGGPDPCEGSPGRPESPLESCAQNWKMPPYHLPRWRNWQTRMVQVHVPV